ncbi:hypothetical protein RCG67_06560 [Kocuria sp. CPCC 205292]|uniref:hypothetical protein n=1 Tax=Kocuria cellulosilytica TaxID=3071451 RepID=UPI0034D607F1
MTVSSPIPAPVPGRPASTPPRVSRYRMQVDRPGLDLRAGETVLCAPYEPAELNMVVVVRCEADGHSPGALLPLGEVEHLGPTDEHLGPCSWGKPGVRR